MIKFHIENKITQKLLFHPTETQKEAIRLLSEFISFADKNQVFLLTGFAGTGKTTLIKALTDTLDEFKLNSMLMAPTGRAAKVMSLYTGKPASTIHRKIFRQKSAKDGFGRFELDFNPHSHTFFMVDEASMISNKSEGLNVFGSGYLLEDLYAYVFSGQNCKLLLIGDEAQLPPVGLAISPALDFDELVSFGFDTNKAKLTDVVRQALDSGILKNSFIVRQMINNKRIDYPKFDLEGFKDIVRIPGEDLIESITESYDNIGTHETMIVCRSNKRANNYNQGIRNSILWRDEDISTGDLLMVVKNNYFWLADENQFNFIANGDIAEIIRLINYEERYGLRFANVWIRLPDYNDIEIEAKIILDTLSHEGPSLSADENKQLFYSVMEDYADEKTRSKQYAKVKEDPFYNALQVKFAYAVTCHKAQGGQWKHVYLDQGFINDEMLSIDYLRWLYTGITRATDKLFLVNFSKYFFEGSDD